MDRAYSSGNISRLEYENRSMLIEHFAKYSQVMSFGKTDGTTERITTGVGVREATPGAVNARAA